MLVELHGSYLAPRPGPSGLLPRLAKLPLDIARDRCFAAAARSELYPCACGAPRRRIGSPTIASPRTLPCPQTADRRMRHGWKLSRRRGSQVNATVRRMAGLSHGFQQLLLLIARAHRSGSMRRDSVTLRLPRRQPSKLSPCTTSSDTKRSETHAECTAGVPMIADKPRNGAGIGIGLIC